MLPLSLNRRSRFPICWIAVLVTGVVQIAGRGRQTVLDSEHGSPAGFLVSAQPADRAQPASPKSSVSEAAVDHAARKVADHVEALLAYWDRDLRCRFANSAHRVWLGKSPEQIVGRSLQETHGPLYDSNLPHIRDALKGDVRVFECAMPAPDGTVRQGLVSCYPDIVDGEVLGLSVQVTDVTRLRQLERELVEVKLQAENLATHDLLTGL